MISRICRSVVRRTFCAVLLAMLSTASRPALAQTQAPPPNRHQSPLEFTSSVPFDDRPPKFNDTAALQKPITLTLKNPTGALWCSAAGCDDHRVQRKWASLKAYPARDAAPRILWGRDWYVLQEFHFHTPAEHIVDGVLHPMEVHFVFRKEGRPSCDPWEFLVVGQMIRKGKDNQELDKIFGPKVMLPENYQSPTVTVNNFVIGNVLVGLDRAYRYRGSLTAPADIGCPPGNPLRQLSTNTFPQVVSWVLLATPIDMSQGQIERFQKLFPEGNARKVQHGAESVTRTFR